MKEELPVRARLCDVPVKLGHSLLAEIQKRLDKLDMFSCDIPEIGELLELLGYDLFIRTLSMEQQEFWALYGTKLTVDIDRERMKQLVAIHFSSCLKCQLIVENDIWLDEVFETTLSMEVSLPSTKAESASSNASSNFTGDDTLTAISAHCPSADTISALIKSGNIPEGILRSHVFRCSECFSDYNRMNASKSSTPTAVTQSWTTRLRHAFERKTILSKKSAPLVVFGIAALVGLFMWRHRQRFAVLVLFALLVLYGILYTTPDKGKTALIGTEQAVDPQLVPSDEGPIKETASSFTGKEVSALQNARKAVTKRLRVSNKTSVRLVAQAPVLDLDSVPFYSRGPAVLDDNKQAPLRIFYSRIHSTTLPLKLPEGSKKGLYTISIRDIAFLKKVTPEIQAESRDGKNLVIELEMRNLPEDQYFLRVERKGKSAEDYKIEITPRE